MSGETTYNIHMFVFLKCEEKINKMSTENQQKRYLCDTFPYKCINTKWEGYQFDDNNGLTESRNESRQVELKLLI
ncbi:hypothetical protein, partial [Bacillus mobilis]|uniref:hypothetical protein n=1 Tax=Bacillus mobilis TaxID=2026190 RepID=UPI0021CDCAE0